MKLKNLVFTGLCAAAAAILLPACSTLDVHGGAGVSVGSGPAAHAPGPAVHSGGPPDHAPAHGYRKKHHHHHDLEMVYDSGLGVYVVAGYKGLYFHGDYFYRMDDGGSWGVSVNVNGPWEHHAYHKVPKGLHEHGKKHGKKKGKSKGKGHQKA